MCFAIWSFWIAASVRAERGFLVVEIGLRRGREHVHVDAGRIHVAQAACDIEAAASGTAGNHAADVERRRSLAVDRA